MAKDCSPCGTVFSDDCARSYETFSYRFPAGRRAALRFASRRRVGTYGIAVLVALLVVLFVVVISGPEPEVQATRAAAPPAPPKVVYSVRGTANSATLTFENASGGTEQRRVTLPWTLELESAPPGRVAFLSADNEGDSGSVVATISVDGKVLKTAESSAPYVTASVSGLVPSTSAR